MRTPIKLYNELLRRYNKYRNKLQRLQQAGKNERRQFILQKHINRLFAKLSSIWVGLQKPAAIASVALAAVAFQPQEANAQTFAAPLPNPFGLTQQLPADLHCPAFVDIDDDGDFDIMTGEYLGTHNFIFIENIGTPNAPAFDTSQVNPFSLTATNNDLPTPGFADLDNDGDFDMLAGERYGAFLYYENIGTASAPTFAAPVINAFGLTDTASYKTTYFEDLDGDGDFDLICGSFTPSGMFYYENIGTINAPAFAIPISHPFGLTPIGSNLPSPRLIDMDLDGDFDLFASDGIGGNFWYCENTGTINAPAFGAQQLNPFSLVPTGATFNYPAFADLDGDCDLDIMTGERPGNFAYFENTTPVNAAEITLKGNNIEIIDGDTLPAYTDSTDFDSVCVYGSDVRLYTIVNDGVDTLTVDPNVLVSGTNAADFSITSQPSALVPPSDSTTFTVQIAPSALGLREATITINNGDCSEFIYTFAVQGTGIGPDLSVTNNTPTLTANATGATYQWLNCDSNFVAINGETNQSFTPTANGNYAVIVTENGCTDTSACEAVTNVGIQENALVHNLKVYPNPSTGMFVVKAPIKGVFDVYNITGRLITQGEFNQPLSLAEFGKGLYFVKYQATMVKVVVQ